MTGRVIIVTGANTGLGYEVARYLCEGGNDVIMACRDEQKATASISKIKAANPNALVTFMSIDLADLDSVRAFVDAFHATEKKLHALVNNAGVMMNWKDGKRRYTKQNMELSMGVNYMGHFLLANLLLDDLKSTGSEEQEARIVNVTSSMHDPDFLRKKNRQQKELSALDMEDIFCFKDGSYSGLQAYKNSKLAQIMFCNELARRLEGSHVTVNCICPGWVPSTELGRNFSSVHKFYSRYIMHGALRFLKLTRSVGQGGAAVAALATDEKYKGESGKLYKDGIEVKPSEESQVEENQKKLWELSAGYCCLDGYEPLNCPEPVPEPAKEEKKSLRRSFFKTKQGADTAIEEAKGKVEEGAGDAAEAVDNAVESAKNALEEAGDSTKKTAEAVVEDSSKKVSDGIAAIDSSVQDVIVESGEMKQKSERTVMEKFEEVKEDGTKVVKTVETKVVSITSQIGDDTVKKIDLADPSNMLISVGGEKEPEDK